jgi:DNA-binding NtrC family response regulator
MPMAMQVKLLRLLQQREYSPVGDSRTLKCDIRVVAATNRDLAAEVKAGRFREDLFYRLNVIHLQLPALRERPDDLPSLIEHFFSRMCADLGRGDLVGISAEARSVLATYAWPGNVRELENTIERVVLLSAGPMVEIRDLPPAVRGADGAAARESRVGMVLELPALGIDLKSAVEQYESNLIRQALERTHGNKNRAAQLLGLNRTTLVEMVKRKRLAACA